MYYNGDITKLFNTCTAIIGKREAGKTTILKKLLDYAFSRNYTILIFDSATDHKEKSLLIHASNKFLNAQLIPSPEKDRICFNFDEQNYDYYPAEIVANSKTNIFLFDVSRYLEEGYDTEDLQAREKIREFYKRLVHQELHIMKNTAFRHQTIILLDEIELLDDMKKLLEEYKIHNVTIVVALHCINSLANCKSVFNIITL